MNKHPSAKIKSNDSIYAVKVKTESNSLGALKTLIVLALIAIQATILISSYFYLLDLFRFYLTFELIVMAATCVHILSSEYHGQAKATWIIFIVISFGFGCIIYIFSDKRVFFGRKSKRYNKILNETKDLQKQADLSLIKDENVKSNCKYLYNAGAFKTHFDSKTTYFPSGTKLFDEILSSLENAKKFIFIEYFIMSDSVLLNKFLNILKQKASEGVDVRMIYDDMGSHGTLSRKTKKSIIKSGIKLKAFNRLIPVFNIGLNLRDHRKIVVIDGKVSFTGGANLADEYTNEKRMHGYWKDAGIKIEGTATNNFTIAFLNEWQFLTNEKPDYKQFLNKSKSTETFETTVPFVSGPNYPYSIAQNMYANQISNSKEKLYIMTPYFIPDETINNLLINKARAGVDVRIILPHIADKKFVYVVSRSNAEKLMKHGIKLYVMKHSFVHSKVMLNENSAIVGSINIDLRSFNQQFESAVLTDGKQTLKQIESDFENTFTWCEKITLKTQKRNSVLYRILAGFFNIISPFM